MKIIKATIDHLKDLSILFDQYRIFYHQKSDVENAKLFLKERLNNQESVIFLAQHSNGKVAGFVQLYPIFSSVSMKRSWLLNDLYVAPTFRQQGVGVALIDAAKMLCATTSAKGLLLETGADNVKAQALYVKTGFQKETNFFYFWKKNGG